MSVMSSEVLRSNNVYNEFMNLPSYRAVSASKFKQKNFNSLNSLPCFYGEIVYSSSSHESDYTLQYGNYDVDIDYVKDLFNDGYSLKVALYKDGVMVSYVNEICYDLPTGIVESCERMLKRNIDS